MAEINQIPALLDNPQAEAMFVTVAGKLENGTGDVATTRDTFFQQALYQASCKAAIKAGRVYDKEHIKWICDKVFTLDNIKYCPHGRPIAYKLTKRELDRQFERIK